jgi:hypothetical protein
LNDWKNKQEVELAIEKALGALGYSRVRRRVFKAPWSSTDIDHIIYLEWHEKYGTRISVQVGIRHRRAQEFAMAMLRAHGAWATRQLLQVGKYGSLFVSDLGKISSWPIPWSLDPAEKGTDSCVRKITMSLQEKLFPLIGEVRDDHTMYNFLTQMKIEALWPANGAVRAAETIFIGKGLGYRKDKVMADIELFGAYITSQIARDMTVAEFLLQAWSSA